MTSEHLAQHKDENTKFDKNDYYAHPENYKSIFYEKVILCYPRKTSY